MCLIQSTRLCLKFDWNKAKYENKNVYGIKIAVISDASSEHASFGAFKKSFYEIKICASPPHCLTKNI